MDTAKLETLGFTHNEALTYEALLETGETKTGALVKKTGLHRVLIYDALESLIRKGLVSYVIKENIKYFQAANPDRLVDFIEEKKELAEKLVPELKNLQVEIGSKQSVSIYEGIVGLKSVLNNMLKELTSKDYHYVFGSGQMSSAVGPYYEQYQNEKKRKKILTKAVVDLSFKKLPKSVFDATYAKIRYYPLGEFPSDTWIYKDKVLIVTYTSKPPVAILIISQETANSYKKLFEGYWEKAKE